MSLGPNLFPAEGIAAGRSPTTYKPGFRSGASGVTV